MRIKAFLIHLAGSISIGLVTLVLVFGFWYPAPLHSALSVTCIFLLLLFVDVILGPFLTLLVFKVGKKTLLFDLSVILFFQFIALSYGVWAVFSARPAWIVFNVDRFDVVQVVDLDTRKLDEAELHYKRNSWFGPQWVGAMRPQDAEQRKTIMFESVLYGSDIAHRPNLYRPLDQFVGEIKKVGKPLKKLRDFNSDETVNLVLSRWPEAVAWLPLKARAKPMVVLIAEDASVLGIVDLNPWD